MDNLSVEDEVAEKALRAQGWDGDKVEEVLDSGDNFTETSYQMGDKLYNFNTAGRARKLDTSALKLLPGK